MTASPISRLDELFSDQYKNLQMRAARQLKRWPGREPVERDELIHLLYQKLHRNGLVKINNHEHFLNLAEKNMRNILIDCSRHDKSVIRGGDKKFFPIDDQFKY